MVCLRFFIISFFTNFFCCSNLIFHIENKKKKGGNLNCTLMGQPGREKRRCVLLCRTTTA